MSDLVTFWVDSLPALLRGLRISLEVLGATLVLGIPLGFLLSLGVSARSWPLRIVSICLVEIGRGAPALILIQFAYFGLPAAGLTLSSFASAVLALAFNTGAYTSEIIRAGLEAVPKGEREAAEALGLSRSDQLRYVIIPQALRISVPPLLGFSILMFQGTSLCFAVALPELLSRAYAIGFSTFRYLPILALAAALYALICIPASLAVSALERRLSRSQ